VWTTHRFYNKKINIDEYYVCSFEKYERLCDDEDETQDEHPTVVVLQNETVVRVYPVLDLQTHVDHVTQSKYCALNQHIDTPTDELESGEERKRRRWEQ